MCCNWSGRAGEWSFIGGYAGQVITAHGTSLGVLADPRLGAGVRGAAGYTIDTNRSVAVETVVRQNGRGMYLKPEYTPGVRTALASDGRLRADSRDEGDFLGQYRRNSHGILTIRI